MKLNVGGIDRILRILVGLALIVAAALGYIGWWGYIGVAPLVTGIFQFLSSIPAAGPEHLPGVIEIGRASCRERV